MLKLIQQCLAGDSHAWADLWLLYDHHVAQPVRRLLVRAGFDASEADDVAIEVFARLHGRGCRRLRSFHGNSFAELTRWLVRLAANLTRDWTKKSWKAKRREREGGKRSAARTRPSATGPEVQSLLDELETVMPREDVDRLRRLAGFDAGTAEPTSGRTERRRRGDLERKLREYLGIPNRRKLSRSKGKRTKS